MVLLAYVLDELQTRRVAIVRKANPLAGRRPAISPRAPATFVMQDPMPSMLRDFADSVGGILQKRRTVEYEQKGERRAGER